MKKYIFLVTTLILLLFTVKVSADPSYQSVNINNTNTEQPVCVWVGHEPTYPVDVDANFWSYTDLTLNGTWEGNYMNIDDSYLFGGFVGTCSSNIDENGKFIDESIVVETSGDVKGYLDYMVINFDGTFDIEIHYIDYDPTVTYPSEVEIYNELYNNSVEDTVCFFINDETTNAYEVLPGEYGWAYEYVNGEIDGGGWVVNHNDTMKVSAFVGACSTNINQNGVIDQAKVLNKEVTFDGLVNMVAVEFDGSRLDVDAIYMEDYDEWHDGHLEPAPVATAVAISTVTTVASVGVASAIASGTASTVATGAAASAASSATSTVTSTATTAATNAMNAPKLTKRFKDRYVKGYKLNAKTSFEKAAHVGTLFTLDTQILRKYSGEKTGYDAELTDLVSISSLSDMITKLNETKDSKGIHSTFSVIGVSAEPQLIQFRVKVGKKEIVQTIEIPVE